MIHELKLDTKFFKRVMAGKKRAEIRYNDRNYQVGDFLLLREVTGTDRRYTGARTMQLVLDIVTHEEFPAGIQEGYVMISFRAPSGYESGLKGQQNETNQ